MKDSEKLLKPMTLGDVLDYSIQAYKRNIKSIALILLVTLLPLTILSAVINGLYQSIELPYTLKRYYYLSKGYTFAYHFLKKPSMPIALSLFSTLFIFFGFVHYLLIRPVIYAAVTKVIYNDVVTNEKQEVKQVLKESFGRFGALVGNWVLYLLITGGIVTGISVAAIIIYAIAASIAALFSAAGLAGIIFGVILVCLISIAAVLAVIIFYCYFKVRFYGIFSVIIERKFATEAFSRSMELTRKNFWHISLACAFAELFTMLLTVLFTYGTYAGILVNKSFFVFVYIIGHLLSSFIATFMTTVFTMIYINMKIKKEGLDLEIRVDRLLERKKRSETEENIND